MDLVRAVVAGAVAVAAGAIALSGAAETDPRTPAGLPGLPAPFLGIAVVGNGGRTAAIDAYGSVVDMRAPGPAGPALLAVPSARQAAGTVDSEQAIVARARVGRRRPALWHADSIRQRYVSGTNVLRTIARFGSRAVVIVRRVGGAGAMWADRRWLARARPLRRDAPPWARAMYSRSLLVLRALTDRRTGAAVAGARDGWAYVWPRDAGAAALAFASAGYMGEAQRVARFLLGLDLDAAARFDGAGAPVPGRGPQGDAAGWVAVAARAAGLRPGPVRAAEPGRGLDGESRGRDADADAWRGRADYHEGDPGDYLANAIASGAGAARIRSLFLSPRGLMRESADRGSGLESAAAWAVRPFPRPALFPAVRRTLLRLVARRQSGFGLLPSEDWRGGRDPWTAPTAWAAWALAALAREAGASDRSRGAARTSRSAALSLMADLRRAATPLGLLPERVDVRLGLPRSTTPLAWSHAFAILALGELWRGRAGS